jgi:hypothetical protein
MIMETTEWDANSITMAWVPLFLRTPPILVVKSLHALARLVVKSGLYKQLSPHHHPVKCTDQIGQPNDHHQSDMKRT